MRICGIVLYSTVQSCTDGQICFLVQKLFQIINTLKTTIVQIPIMSLLDDTTEVKICVYYFQVAIPDRCDILPLIPG